MSKRRRQSQVEESFFTVGYQNLASSARSQSTTKKKEVRHPTQSNGIAIEDAKYKHLSSLSAVDCQWGDKVVLDNASKKGLVCSCKLLFSHYLNDKDKEVFVRSAVVLVNNIIFNVSLSYTLVDTGNHFDIVINTSTITNPKNSKGKNVVLIVSEEVKRAVIADILDASECDYANIIY